MQPRSSARLGLFAAAAVSSLTVVLAIASCGPTEPVHCGPDTCSGCCTGDDKCVAKEKQSFQACGADGKTCSACLPGYACNNGVCAQSGDAGNGGGGCDSSSCSGCCLGDTCLSFGDQSTTACGNGGTTCSACLSGSTCQDGACMLSMDAGACGKKGAPCCANQGCFLGLTCQKGVCDTATGSDGGSSGNDGGTDGGTDAGTDGGSSGTQPIGAACVGNSQCQSGLCRVLGFANGYCTKTCNTNADCPNGSACGADPADSTGQMKICYSTCATAGTTAGCRTSYVCEKRGMVTGGPACQPGCVSATTCGSANNCDTRGFCCGADGYACCDGATCDNGLLCDTQSGYCKPPPADAGPGKGAIGDACSVNAGCASNVCVQEQAGGQTGCTTGPCWPGGYCIQDCTSAACPSGSSCSPYLATNKICVENCPNAGVQSTCRAGYVCDKNWIPSSSQGTCVDACNSNADCNSATLNCFNGFCCGKQSYHCCSGNTCPFGGTCGTDGYCQ